MKTSARTTSADESGSRQTHLGFPDDVLDELSSEHQGLGNLALLKRHADCSKAGGGVFEDVGGIPYGYDGWFGGMHVD